MRILTAGPSALLLTAALALATPAGATTAQTPSSADRAAAGPAITIAVKSPVVTRGKKVVVTGTVTNKKVTKVTLQQKRKGTSWKAQATAMVKADGTYRLKDKTTTAVTRKYRVISATGPKKKSAKVTVGVYEWKDLTKLKVRTSMGWSQQNTVQINATTYSPALVGYVWSGPSLVDYNLNHNCISLRARLGLSDSSDSTAQATISVLSDDTAVYAKSFRLTQSEVVTVPLGSPFRVGLSFTADNPGNLTPAPRTVPVAADPEVFCTSGK
ncbi:hypothetical protein QI633_11035 [Nocardioides sp. QY071]|uniref:NPCBM/NEW2 domain-containing protein n=1 Tax=Nocardioides sp. QY071 TaxID=3044187 RepID=UPI00249BC7B8|nr:NPCBM/NEW2 domain-containing protein [Nocardioides sp. QY071]WGY04281.1 hypothetical protein QI633_11035 [Nocardioides sp. QY071]